MTITNGYTSVKALNKRLGQNFQHGDGFNICEEVIEAASRFIDEKTGRLFYTQTLTNETLDVYGESSNGLYVSGKQCNIYAPAPILTVTSITENGTTLTEDENFYIYASDFKISKNGRWTTSRKGIVINGSIGYDKTPQEIEQICLTVAEVFSGLGIRTIKSVDGGEFDVALKTIPSWVFKRLKQYEIIPVR